MKSVQKGHAPDLRAGIPWIAHAERQSFGSSESYQVSGHILYGVPWESG